MTDIGELVVRIKADASQLQQELRNATTSTQQSANQMSNSLDQVKSSLEELLPAFSAAALVDFGKSAIDSAENLDHMADRIGFTVQTLSALQPTLEKNGSSVDEFATSVNFLNRNLGLAASGNAPQLITKFDALGLSVSNLMALNPEQRFFAVAQALGQNDDQATLAADAFLLMGRGVAGLLPTLKETGGNFDDVIAKARSLGQVITPEQEKNVRAFESAWVDLMIHMKTSILDTMPAVNLLLSGIEGIVNLPSHASAAGDDLAKALHLGKYSSVSASAPPSATSITHDPSAINAALKARGLPGISQSNPGAGNNNDLIGGDNGPEVPDQVAAYIDKLKGEAQALDQSKTQLALYKAEQEGVAKAQEEVNDGIRDKAELTPQEKTDIDNATLAYVNQQEALQKLHQEQQKQIEIMANLQSQIASSLADAIVNYKSFGASVSNVLQQIAKEIIELEITQPLVKGIAGALSSGVGSFFGGGGATSQAAPIQGLGEISVSDLPAFASGGNPPVGSASLVGENGPEIFVPNSAGTIIPNHAMGGTSINVTQVFNMQPGLAETVGAAMQNIAPSIAAAAHASVFQAIQRGGSESRIVGKRS